MKTLQVLCPWKVKDPSLLKLEKDYLKRLSPPVEIKEVKPSELAKHLSKGSGHIIGLDERGWSPTSLELADYLEKTLEIHPSVSFVLGGAEGHLNEVRDQFNKTLSLSPLTFPHKIARLMLIEQLYRSQTLRQGHPYHNQ